MSLDRKQHWNAVYAGKRPDELSWFQLRPETSLTLLERTGLQAGEGIIDVGGGVSTFTSVLLDEGYRDLSVLDVSGQALSVAQERFGAQAWEVDWIESDVLHFDPHRQWSLWHDRAVFHFLTSTQERRAYREVLGKSLASNGHVIIATFSPDGPTRCSGLDCVRYGPETLNDALGKEFRLRGTEWEVHVTPGGKTQSFMYAWFQRQGP